MLGDFGYLIFRYFRETKKLTLTHTNSNPNLDAKFVCKNIPEITN
jgi:hypothetical protein